jgi:hypothetical protein
MSLGAPREEQDKSGNACLVCDVAVNSAWFADCVENSLIFTTFVVHGLLNPLDGRDLRVSHLEYILKKSRHFFNTNF